MFAPKTGSRAEPDYLPFPPCSIPLPSLTGWCCKAPPSRGPLTAGTARAALRLMGGSRPRSLRLASCPRPTALRLADSPLDPPRLVANVRSADFRDLTIADVVLPYGSVELAATPPWCERASSRSCGASPELTLYEHRFQYLTRFGTIAACPSSPSPSLTLILYLGAPAVGGVIRSFPRRFSIQPISRVRRLEGGSDRSPHAI